MGEGAERGAAGAAGAGRRLTRARRGPGLSEATPRRVPEATTAGAKETAGAATATMVMEGAATALEATADAATTKKTTAGAATAAQTTAGAMGGAAKAKKATAGAATAAQTTAGDAKARKMTAGAVEAVHATYDQPLHTLEAVDATGEGRDPQILRDNTREGVVNIIVHVEPPEPWHTDWDAWQAYFSSYCDRTKQVIPVKETTSRAERNKRLARTKKGDDESQHVPEGVDPYQRTYICTHGWKKRKSRCEGSRPRQHIRLTDCPFRFVVQWDNEKASLHVKSGCFIHNHNISEEAYETYPSVRGVTNPVVGARVEGMLAAGAKRSRIYDYLLAHDQNVIQVDVDNLVREYSALETGVDDNVATERELALFAAADPENVVTVAETDAGETGVISLATAHMRRVFGRFSEILMVDCSHKTNRYNYQLLTFMAVNAFGEGAVVQHSLIEANGDWHMEKAISHFRRMHPTRIDHLRVIVVDKDLNEIRVLESNFPDARILICHFHVIKYFKKKRSKPEFGKTSTEDSSQIDAAIHNMVYASCEDDYERNLDTLKGLCDRIGLQEFFNYLERNWNDCQDRWVMFRRANLPHLKNHTNNRLERFFGKLKDGIDSSMGMSACIKALLAYDRRVENELQYRSLRIGQYVNCNYDEEMANVLRFTSHNVAEHISHEYARALAKAESYVYMDDEDDTNQIKEHTLQLSDWSCNCEFAVSMLLPCRHAMAYRHAHSTPGPVIPWKRIDERWTSSRTTLNRVTQFAYEKFSDAIAGQGHKKQRTQADKYREAVRATHLIASELADIRDDLEYEDMLQFVMNQWRNVRQRKMVKETPPIETKVRESGFLPHENDAEVRAALDISSSEHESEDEGVYDDPDDDERSRASHASGVKIKLNPAAKKVGAPRKMRKTTVAGEKCDRKWFEAAEAGRKKAGEVTLRDLMTSLDREQPGLLDTQRRLSGIIEKFKECENKKPKFKRMKNPVLIMDPFFILPSKLLNACIQALPLRNDATSAISVDDMEGTEVTTEGQDEWVDTVQIKGVGSFSRTQIEIFKRVENLKTSTQLGLDMHKWLVENGLPALPAEYHHVVKDVASTILGAYPFKRIDGMENMSDYVFSMLYRLTPPTWLSDASISALCVRLFQDYPECRFAGFQSAETTRRRTRSDNDTHASNARVLQYLAEDGMETVMLPLNFHNAHWCCLIVKVKAKRIFYYDPLNQRPYMNAAKAIASSFKLNGLKDYDVISQNNPIQFDAFSCGVYVSWMFIQQVVAGSPPDMSATSLPRRRFELFYYLMTGTLLPVAVTSEDIEEKRQAPVSTDIHNSDDEDDIPQTQVAQ